MNRALLLWRLQRGLTQQALAAKARVPRSNLSAIERGKREVSLRTLRMLALALDVRPGMLADGMGPGEREPSAGSWPRERLEQVADAVVSHAPIRDVHERALGDALRAVVEPRALVSAGRRRPSHLSRRGRDAAWLAVNAACPPEVIKSLLQRIADRQQTS